MQRFLGLLLLLAGPVSTHAHTLYLTGGLTDNEFVVVSAAVAALDPTATLLPETRNGRDAIRRFIADHPPTRVVPVGQFDGGENALRARYGIAVESVISLSNGQPLALWERLPRCDQAVVVSAEPAALLLAAATLAGTLRQPLALVASANDTETLRSLQSTYRMRRWHACGHVAASAVQAISPDQPCDRLADVVAVLNRRRQLLAASGAVRSLVLANPHDRPLGRGAGMSILAPWLAVRRRAELLLTDSAGRQAGAMVQQSLGQADLRNVDDLLVVAAPEAVPPETRPNPQPGKDARIEMEPGTPIDDEPFTLSTGRLFHTDRAIALLMVERPRHFSTQPGPRSALIVSNPGGSLPLLETFSRHTARELANAGYTTTPRYEGQTSPDEVRSLLPDQDLFLWEGHHGTLVKHYGVPFAPEPLRPSLVFLQSCLALNEPHAGPFLERGAYAVVGSSTRIYSATGGAFTLAFFDALIYDQQSLGGSLRQAKNFLACYARLKRQRLGDESRQDGANLRSAWAFSLWGDPTAQPPRPPRPVNARPAVRVSAQGNLITVSLPEEPYEKIVRTPFVAQMWPNARLAGLLTRDDEDRHLISFVFGEVSLPPPEAGQVPRLRSTLPARQWVFNWDERRERGYLLAIPGKTMRQSITFRVDWSSPERMTDVSRNP